MPDGSRERRSPAQRVADARRQLKSACARWAKAVGATHLAVAIEGPRGTIATTTTGDVPDRAGGDDALTIPLQDAHGAIGSAIVGGVSPETSLDEAIAELTRLARALRDGIDDVRRDRLVKGEHQAMRIALESATPRVLVNAMAKAVRRATESDSASVFVPPKSPAELFGALDADRPPTAGQWEQLRAALRTGGGDPVIRATGEGGYVRADLGDGRPLSPVERWAHDETGMLSIAVRVVRSAHTGLVVTVSLANRLPTQWPAEDLEFASRAAELTLMAVERLRAAAMAPWLHERSEGMAALLGSLGDWRPLRKVAGTFAHELEMRFGVRCLALTALGDDNVAPRALWTAPGLDIDGAALHAAAPPGPFAGATRIPIRDGREEVGIAWIDAHAEVPPATSLREIEAVLQTLGVVIGHGSRLMLLDTEQRALEATAGLLSSLAPESSVKEFGEIVVRQAIRFFNAAVAVVATFSPNGPHVEAMASAHISAEELARPDEDGVSPLDVLDSDDGASFTSADVSVAPPDAYARLMARHGIRSVMRAPMLAPDGTRRGVVMVGSTEPAAWRTRQQRAIRGFASAMALVMERHRVVTSQRRQEERRRAVLGLLAALGPGESISQVANPLCAAIRSMYNADHCSVIVIDGDSAAVAGLSSNMADTTGLLQNATGSLFLHRLTDNGYDLIPDTAALAPRPPVVEAIQGQGIRCVLRVLIGRPGAPAGIIAVASREPGAIRVQDALELREIARPLAVAIDYFARRRESEQRAARLEVINHALEQLTYAGAPAALAAAFLHECRALFGSVFGIVVRWDGDGKPSVVAADSTDGFTPMIRTSDLSILNPLDGPPEPRLLTPADANPANARRLSNAGLRHGLGAPLMAGDISIGVVVLWTRRAEPSPEQDLALLGTLTRPLSVALQRSEAAASLGESESRYRSLIAQAEEMIYLSDSSTLEILEVNPYGARILGYTEDELCGMKTTDIIDDTPAHIRRNARATLDDGEARLPARPYRRRDGSTVVMDVVASSLVFGGRQAILVLGRDVSERHVIEQRLMQGQKMEALGQMAGNVAHDFNNLLTTVLGFAGLLKRAPGMEGEALEHLGLIEDAARRAADLSSRMLSFARGGLVKFGPVDLRHVIEQTLRLAEGGLPGSISVRTRLPSAPVIVEGDAGQLQQALLNIVINARDAMPGGGTLTVRLRAAGDGCVLNISDTGMGMDEQTRMRLFEPFYTTKPTGSGTGLGMAITYGIIQGHHGSIAVTTAVGNGTTFAIRLPLFDADSLPPLEPAAATADRATTGGAVLVVDDDDLVRRTMTATLVDLGYAVVAASGGAEAVELVKAEPQRFAAVVLDLVMAGMSGSRTFHALQAVRKDLPIIICTGYADDEHVDIEVQRGAAAVIFKPFNPDALARALRLAGAFPVARR